MANIGAESVTVKPDLLKELHIRNQDNDNKSYDIIYGFGQVANYPQLIYTYTNTLMSYGNVEYHLFLFGHHNCIEIITIIFLLLVREKILRT